jgi:hypothetical protein
LLHPMKNLRTSLTLRVAIVVAVLCVPLAAQEVTSPRPPEKPAPTDKPAPTEKAADAGEAAPRRVEEVEPSLYYLKDEKGNLQPIPNFKYADFMELYKLKHQLVQGDQRPRYSLQQMIASGTVNAAGQAELSIQFRILVREDQWTRIPLRLDQAILREPAQYQGGGEHFLDFEGDGAGYVAWIRGAAGQQHQLSLKVLVPLTVLGQETRLRLLAPRVTASELKFKVPLAHAVARVSEGATLQTSLSNTLRAPAVSAPGALEPAETELTVVGLNSEFELTWHPSNASPSKAAALEAVGNIAARLDARGVEIDANFTVRSFGEAFDRFHIRLPPDCVLVPGNPNGYTLTMVDAGPPAGTMGQTAAPARQRVVEVQLAKRSVGPVEVHLSTQRAANHSLPRPQFPGEFGWLELAGFEFPEAARQWGTIAVSVAGDWQILWGVSRGVSQIQIDQLPDDLRRKDVTAGFEYFAQPSSLPARVVPRKTRIGVEPEYVVLVDSDQLRLEARLRYTVRGAKIAAVDVAMPDWQIDEVAPDSVVAVDGVPTGAASPLVSLPLVTPTIGQFEIRMKAHRPLSPTAKSFTLSLPQPQASAPAAAVVAILPADNVEILPNSQAITGLLRQQTAVPLELPPRQQDPLFYRSDAPKAVFAAELRRHQQKITVGVTSRVNLELAGGRVEQRFAYTIAYEPADYVLLEVPRELNAKGRLVLTSDDQVVTPVPLSEESEDGAKPQRMRVALPKSYIGLCEITARYSLPPSAPAEDGMLHVPLIMPLEAELASNALTITPAAEQQVEVAAGAWTAVERGLVQASSPRSRELSATQPAAEIVLKLRGESGVDAPIVVDRAWIQTCVTQEAAAARQDQVVLQLATRRRELEITLPEGAAREQAAVLVARVAAGDPRAGAPAVALPVTPRTRGDRGLIIPLSADAEPTGYYVISLQYHFPGQRASRGAMKFEFPGLGKEAWIHRAYWQLLLPPEEHLVETPRDLTSEFVWGWNRFYFGRLPVLSQTDLETWAWGSVRHPSNSPAPAGMNVYLFSSLGRIDSCAIVTAGRSMIVFVCSGLALLAGLILIYVRAARHPVVLLAAAVFLVGLTAIYPELALLAAQASAVGLALALLAAFLRKLTTVSDQPLFLESPSTVGPVEPQPRPSEPSVPLPLSQSSRKVAIVPIPPEAVT